MTVNDNQGGVILNDEEPSPSAMDRLWDALDATLSPTPPPAGTSGRCLCLRCGWRWNPRHPDPAYHPRCCANILCHSSYWDIPPTRRYARRPSDKDIVSPESPHRQSINAARARDNRKRRARTLIKKARELGLDIEDAVKLDMRRRAKDYSVAPVTPPTAAAPLPPVGPPRPLTEYRPPAAFRPTVPPPPGLDDLEGQ
jgi:hypothetical protein